MYRCEMSEAEHVELLKLARRLPCPTMLCGYMSELYSEALADWRRVEYFAVNRAGKRCLEIAWCNYPEPDVLHDSRFVGQDKREREKVRRRIRRLVANLNALPNHARQSVIDHIRESEDE